MNFVNMNGMGDILSIGSQAYSRIVDIPAGTIAVLIVSLLFCFLGFRLTKVVSAVVGGVVGGILCAFVAANFLPEGIAIIGTIAAGVIGALLVAYLFYHISYAVVFCVCAAAGAGLGSIPVLAAGLNESNTIVFYAVIAVCALLFGAAGVLFFKPVVIILTGFSGIFAAPQIMTIAGIEGGMKIKLLAGVALSILGIIVQFLTNRKRSKPGFRKEKSVTNNDSADMEQTELMEGDVIDDGTRPIGITPAEIEYQEIDETPEPPRMVADDLGEAMRRKGFMRFMMILAPLLMILSAVVVIGLQSPHVEIVMIFAFLCYAGRRYKLLSVTFLALFANALYSCFDPLAEGNIPELAISAVSTFLFLILIMSMLKMDRKAHPKKRVRRVPVEQSDEEDDHLEETRPLTASDVAQSLQDTQVHTDVDAMMSTQKLGEDDTKTFDAAIPEDFRRTQQAIFGEEHFGVDDDMAAEPDAASQADEELGDTRTI